MDKATVVLRSPISLSPNSEWKSCPSFLFCPPYNPCASVFIRGFTRLIERREPTYENAQKKFNRSKQRKRRPKSESLFSPFPPVQIGSRELAGLFFETFFHPFLRIRMNSYAYRTDNSNHRDGPAGPLNPQSSTLNRLRPRHRLQLLV